jgi:hypothetical protein
MAVGDIGHWRDSAGSQIPGTSFGALNFASQQRLDNSNYSKPNDSTIEVESAGNFLIIANIKYQDNSNGRFNPKGTISQVSGSATGFWSSFYDGYSRDTSEDQAFVRIIAVVHGASANDQFQIQHLRDADAPTGGTVANESDVQIIQLAYSNIGMYRDTAGGAAYGGTVPNVVNLDSSIVETDTAAIERVNDIVTVKGDNKRYLAIYCVSFNSTTSRTQRIAHLAIDGVEDSASKSYAYGRSITNEYMGLGGMHLIETATANKTIEVEAFRGVGTASDQGGAFQDGGGLSIVNESGLVVIELNDSVELFLSHDSVGLQDVTGTTKTTINAMETVDFNDSASFTKTSNTQMDCTIDMDLLCWANIWTARNNAGSGSRFTGLANIDIAGVDQTTGGHGNYSRGSSGSIGTFGCSFHPGGIFSVSATDDVSLEMVRITGGESGGTDRTQPGTVGFLAINLDTLQPTGTDVNISADITGTGQIIAPVEVGTNISADITGTGQIQASLEVANNISAIIPGSGTVTANLEVANNISANVLGSGVVTADLKAAINIAADVLGNGIVSSDLVIEKYISADILGSGPVNVTLQILFDALNIDIITTSGIITRELETSGEISRNLLTTGIIDRKLITTGEIDRKLQTTGVLE